MRLRRFQTILSFCLILFLFDFTWARDFPLTLVHVNDTHSHLEPGQLALKVRGKSITISVGGLARLKTLVDKWHKEDPQLLFLHAGDVVQGTLYFTLFDGVLEFRLLNEMKLSGLVPGNHEFDRGLKAIPRWIKTSKFPWIAANIDFSKEPEIGALVKPYVIKEVRGEKVGIIGLTTEKTPFMALNVGETVFQDPLETARKYVTVLSAQGVNKIIVLSHLGYNRDCELASRVGGIDVIIGGHSHTLLGPQEGLSRIGLAPEGPYPTEVEAPDGNKVLVVQAWRWAHGVGKLKVIFSPNGEVRTYDGSITIPAGPPKRSSKLWKEILASDIVKSVREDVSILEKLGPFRAKIEKYKKKVVGWTKEPLERGCNKALGNLITDAMRDKFPDARVAIYNSGGVRRDLAAGKITVGDIAEVLPFGNTLVLMELTGAQLKKALEDNVKFRIREGGRNPHSLPYISGIKMEVDLHAPAGERVRRILIEGKKGEYADIELQAVYRVVVNSFIAAGGDGFVTLRQLREFCEDTGVLDRDALIEYLRKRNSMSRAKEERVRLLSTSEARDYYFCPKISLGNARSAVA